MAAALAPRRTRDERDLAVEPSAHAGAPLPRDGRLTSSGHRSALVCRCSQPGYWMGGRLTSSSAAKLVFAQLEVIRGERVVELVGATRTDHDARDRGLGEQPGDRHPRRAHPVRLADAHEHVDDVVGALGLERREVEVDAAGVGLGGASAGELAGEEAARERAPHREGEALVLDHRDELVVEVPPGERSSTPAPTRRTRGRGAADTPSAFITCHAARFEQPT